MYKGFDRISLESGIGVPIGLTALELAQRLAEEIRCLINQG